MEKRGRMTCAWVNGNVEDLNRATLREEFSKFGNVKKIFIDTENSYAKIYFTDLGCIDPACSQLNGRNGWIVKPFKETYPHSQLNNNEFANINKPYTSEGHKNENPQNSFSGNSSTNNLLEEMDEECVYAGEYVDVHGRPVEVLQAENGQHYVNLDDVRAGGYNIYPKDSFENATISIDVDMRHFENYLLNQGKKYILNFKQKFNEDEMLSVFERVQAKLRSAKPSPQFGEGRLINNAQSKNFSITTRNSNPPASGAGGFRDANRPQKRLPDNCQPSFRNYGNQDYQKSGKPPSNNDSRRPQNNPKFNTRRSGESLWDRKSDGQGVADTNNASSPYVRKPKFHDSNVARSKPPVPSNEPEEVWAEGNEPKDDAVVDVVAAAPKEKSPNSSVGNERTILNIERVQLAAGSNYKVTVSYANPDKKRLFYGQLLENSNLIQEILLKVNTKDLLLPEISKPVRGMLCVTYFEDCWYRAVVLRDKPTTGTVLVELIDYGNKENVTTPVREMSEELKKVPGQAVRCAVHSADDDSDGDSVLEVGQNLDVFVKKHYDDMTHLVVIKTIIETPNVDDEPSTPPNEKICPEVVPLVVEEDCFTQVPPSAAKIVPGESVIVVNYTENKLILRNKETATICKNVYTHLKDMRKKPISEPKVGQLVLCSNDADEGLHRAVILKINDRTAELEFIDFYGGETLSLKSLRNVDKVLASFPSAKFEVNYPALKNLTKQSDDLLQDLVVSKKKIKTTEVNSAIDFLLPEGDKSILLSEKIKQLASPPPPKPEPVMAPITSTSTPKRIEEKPSSSSKPTQVAAPKQEPPPPAAVAAAVAPQEDGQVLFDDMPFVKAALGLGDYSCYACRGDSITLISLSEENASHLVALDITEPSDTTPHTPDLLGMCLAKFKDTWYRALVTDIEGDTYEVLFVDYGNAENVSKNDLRRLPKTLEEVPIIGINCYFVGIPDSTKVHNRLKELIPDEEILEVDVKVGLNDDQKYGIEIPSVYQTLRTEGLL